MVAPSFGDIFRANAIKNGLLPVQLEAETCASLQSVARKNPEIELCVDLEKRELVHPDVGPHSFPIDEFSRSCLMKGLDQLGYLLEAAGEIDRFEKDCE